MGLSLCVGTCYRDKPDYGFMLSMLQLMNDEQVGHIPRQRHLPDAAREAIGASFLKSVGNYEWLLFADDDMNFPRGYVQRLVSRQKLIVAGLYFLKSGDLAPMMYDHVGLLLDWRDWHGVPVIRYEAKGGGFYFGIYNGQIWEPVGERFEEKPTWAILPGGLIDTSCERVLASGAIEKIEAAMSSKLEWLEELGPYTINIYMPLWAPVARWLAAHSREEYLKPGPLLLPDDEGAVVEVDAAGTGCMLIHRSVLEKVPRPWFSYREGGTEDMYFCRKAQKAGFKVHGDMSVICSHSGTNHTHFLRAYAKEVKDVTSK